MKKRFWVSWWSGYYLAEGCTEPPYQLWSSGIRKREDGDEEMSLCAVIDAESQKEIEKSVAHHFPDYEMRFCDEYESDFNPGDRFPDFENRTSLEE